MNGNGDERGLFLLFLIPPFVLVVFHFSPFLTLIYLRVFLLQTGHNSNICM